MTTEAKGKVSFKFERIEKKFWMSRAQYEALRPVLEAHTEGDAYGESTILNIYYDTPDFALIRRSIERPFFKEKLRLRSYGIPGEEDRVFVELKRKLDGIGYKRRVSLPFKEAKRLLRGEAVEGKDPQVIAEIAEFVERYRPRAAACLSYRRFARTDLEDPELRITIDTKLRWRTEDAENPSEEGMQPIMADDSRVLMEVKCLRGIPPWLLTEMSRLRIYQAPFSKIGEAFTNHIAPNLKFSAT